MAQIVPKSTKDLSMMTSMSRKDKDSDKRWSKEEVAGSYPGMHQASSPFSFKIQSNQTGKYGREILPTHSSIESRL